MSSQYATHVFLGYGEGQKGYRCFNLATQKVYVSHHVVFLEHIPFFSIPSSTHDLTRSDLIRIDSFIEDSDSLSSQVPNTLDSPSHVLSHFPLHYTQSVRASSFAGINTLLSRTPATPSFPAYGLPSSV